MLELPCNDPLSTYTFRVRVGEVEFKFSKMSGLGQGRSQLFTYLESGSNDPIHVLPRTLRNCSTLYLEKGVFIGEFPPLFMEGQWLSGPLLLDCWNETNSSSWGTVYTLTELLVKRFEVGEVDYLHNRVFIDRFDIDYENMHVSTV